MDVAQLYPFDSFATEHLWTALQPSDCAPAFQELCGDRAEGALWTRTSLGQVGLVCLRIDGDADFPGS